MEELFTFFKKPAAHPSPELLFGAVISIATFFVCLAAVKAMLSGMSRVLSKYATKVDELLKESAGSMPLLIAALTSLFVFSKTMELTGLIESIISAAFSATVIVTITLFSSRLAVGLVKKHGGISKTAKNGITLLISISAWVVAGITFLAHVGVNVSTLIASLGVGGIALAFASQKVLSDMFSSFSIYFDRPFAVGDYISFGSNDGIVQHIGIKNTRMETLRGEELIVPNSELVDATVRNFAKLEKRRSTISFGVTYDTSHKKLESIPRLIKDVFKEVKHAQLARCHFVGFGASSLDFSVVYYANTSDYDAFLDIQHALLLGIFKVLEKNTIEMAFPTRTVYMKK